MTPSDSPSRILIIRFSSMGDIVLTSPVTRAIRRIWPETEIDFLAGAEYCDLARALPGVSAVDRLEPAEGFPRLLSRIRRRKYDLVIDLHGNLRSRLVSLGGHARRVVRYDKRRLSRMAIVRRPGGSAAVPHTIDRYLATLDRLGATDASDREGTQGLEMERLPALNVYERSIAMVEERLADAGIGPEVPVLGVAPGASHGPKRWPPDRFARVADHMAESRGMGVLVLGSERDRPVTGEVVRAMGSPAVDWTGAADLSLLPAAVQRCGLMVTNDSGPMHVATAVGTPVVGVFGATHPRLGFAPLGPADAVVTRDLPCSPCSLHGDRPCRYGTHACMEDLPAQNVIAEAEGLISD